MTQTTTRLLPLFLASTMLLGSTGCQHLARFARNFHFRTVHSDVAAVDPGAVENRLYAAAARAIEARDYPTALEALQNARVARANDPRVLNALGVVYDKLGRFDLSAHYYDLAEKADPGSKVVAANRRYSMMLQQGVLPPTADGDIRLASAGDPPPPLAVRPPPTPALSEEALYRRAVTAIQARSFAAALADLTAARASRPDDPRVLSALGVVYDWLGRFDLSAHYYDLAEAADPGSIVVATNRRYSRMLQQHGGADVVSDVVLARDGSSTPVMGMANHGVRTALNSPSHKPAKSLGQ